MIPFLQVPPFLVRKIFTQIFSFINVQLFNRSVYLTWITITNNIAILFKIMIVLFIFPLCSLLLRRECCSFSNGEYVKAGLAELKNWCYYATDEVAIFESCVIFFKKRKNYFLLNKNKCSMQVQHGRSWNIYGRLLGFWY